MKKIFSALFVVLFATSMMAQTGLTCEDPIPVDKDYMGTIDGPCELWYTANTYDLPLDLRFYPNSDNSTWGPEVEIDFTCIPGVYADPKLDSLVNMVGDFDISFPIELLSELVPGATGKNEFHLSVSKSYREQLADFGITYPVQAFVKVRYFEGGTIGFVPDSTFSSCMENADYVNLGDTFSIVANDTERTFVFPYTEWQEDSIRFVWTGSEPAQVYVAVQECAFIPSEEDPYVWSNFAVTQDMPYKLYSEDMKAAIKAHKEGGIYYAKVIAQGVGELVVEKIPMSAAQGGAVLLEHGTEIALEDALYCFPRTWTATQIVVSTTQSVRMYISNTPDFVVSSADQVLATCVASLEESTRAIYLSNEELAAFAKQATSDYLYVRFSCPVSTKLSVDYWSASECADESFMLYPNVPQFIAAKSRSVVYRARYSDFVGAALDIQWDGSSSLPTYIAETCDFTPTNNAAALLVKPAFSVKSGSNYLIEAETIDTWASRIADDGYFYVRFNPTREGMVTFATEKTIILEPVYTTISATLCSGETYDWNGQVYDKSGEYTQTFAAANGADSIVTLNLTILPAVPVTKETATVCHGESFDWQGTTYSESGEYSVTLKNVNGCDSVVTLNLTVLPAVAPTSEEVTVAYGETYEWHGVVYAESGSYTITLQDENGCDYQATLHLTILPNPEKTDLQPTDMMPLALQDAFKVMTMEQGLWSAQDVKMHWDGVSPLHVFVAKQQVYALTPYNRHVLHYEMIPAGADWTLSKDMMAAWESYIAEGVLYVRFLTELPGTLTTTVAE